MKSQKPIIHGRDHSPGGPDPLKSFGAADGDVLSATGDGGIEWATPSAGGASMPWCRAANAQGYSGSDFAVGRSPDPILYSTFSTTDSGTFDFNVTNSPATGDGEVQILRSGLYLIRLSVAPSALTANADPGYNWDLAVQARVIDDASSIYFGMDFAPASTYYTGAAYAFFLSPRDNFATAGYTAPNGNSLRGAGQAQAPEASLFVNLDDSAVAWPATVYNRFHHGLNDADITTIHANSYSLAVVRFGDSNPAAPTG